jgi:hypothetical protein
VAVRATEGALDGLLGVEDGDTDGKAMPPMTFHVPCLMVKKGKTWMIAEARPYAYLPPPPAHMADAKK